MSADRAARLEKIIAYYGLDHLEHSEGFCDENLDEDLRDPDVFLRELLRDAEPATERTWTVYGDGPPAGGEPPLVEKLFPTKGD